MANKENLIPNSERTPEKIHEMTRNGGIKSGQVRREKKLMSQIFADYLEKEHDIIMKDGSKQKLTGHVYMSKVMDKVLSRGDSASVSLMKVISEATEGTKAQHTIVDERALVDKSISDFMTAEEVTKKLNEKI